MEERKLELEEKEIKRFDFTTFELNYIINNANFNDLQLSVFKRLTDKRGRQTIVQISMEENISERTVNRIIKQIKSKILRIL